MPCVPRASSRGGPPHPRAPRCVPPPAAPARARGAAPPAPEPATRARARAACARRARSTNLHPRTNQTHTPRARALTRGRRRARARARAFCPQAAAYDRAAAIWQFLLVKIESELDAEKAVLAAGGLADDDAEDGGGEAARVKRKVQHWRGQYWGAHQRFFKSLIMGFKVRAPAHRKRVENASKPHPMHAATYL